MCLWQFSCHVRFFPLQILPDLRENPAVSFLIPCCCPEGSSNCFGLHCGAMHGSGGVPPAPQEMSVCDGTNPWMWHTLCSPDFPPSLPPSLPNPFLPNRCEGICFMQKQQTKWLGRGPLGWERVREAAGLSPSLAAEPIPGRSCSINISHSSLSP